MEQVAREIFFATIAVYKDKALQITKLANIQATKFKGEKREKTIKERSSRRYTGALCYYTSIQYQWTEQI